MTGSGQPPSTPAGSALDPVTTSLWCVVFAVIATLLQLAQPVWFDADTGYHLAVGRLIREHGVLHSFPWTPFSWLAEHYADTELAFHLLLAALADLSPNLASKIAGVLLGTTLLSTALLVLRAERVPSPGLWVLLALACSGAFIVRFAMVRPHLLAVTLTVLLPWAVLRRRFLIAGLVALAYPWCHLGWISAPGVVGICELARWLGGERPDWRPMLLTVGGVTAGLLLHPNFPQIVEHAWIEIGHTLMASAWGKRGELPIGGEFRALSLVSTLRFVLLPGTLVVGSLVLAVKGRRERPVALAYALTAAVFLGLTLASQRFLEFLAPTAAMAAGLALAHRGRRLAPLMLALSVVFTALVSQPLFHRLLNRTDMFPRPITKLLDQTIPPGAQVFTCDWQLTGEMLLALPGRRFMVALDPILFQREDPRRFREWLALIRRPPPEPARWVGQRFGARFVMCEASEQWRPFLSALWHDPGARLRMNRLPWVVFEIAPVHQGAKGL